MLGMIDRPSISNVRITNTSNREVLSNAVPSFSSDDRLLAATGNIVLITDHENMLMSRPTSATAAYRPASSEGKKCFTKAISKLLMITWPVKNTVPCKHYRKDAEMSQSAAKAN